MRVIVVADGAVPERAALDAARPGWDDDVALVIGADGGARKAVSLGLRPDLVVGDLDSLDAPTAARLEAEGVRFERVAAAKDESDTELACLRAVEHGATAVTILGALGGRFDHALANVWLLALPALEGRSAELLDDRTRIRLLSAPSGASARVELAATVGDVVTLLPFGGDVEGVRTDGLLYPLRDEPLRVGPSRGLSNVCTARGASVSIRSGRLLVIETVAAGSEAGGASGSEGAGS